MTDRTVSIVLTGTNASAVRALEGTSAAATRAGANVESKMGGAASKVSTAFSKLDQQLGKFGLPFAGALTAVGGKLEQTEGKTKTFGSTLSTIGGASILAAGAGLALVGGSAVKMAENFDTAHTTLKTAVAAVGESFNAYSGQIAATDSKLIALGFTETDTETSLATLTTATKSVGFATSLMGLAANIARGRHIDLAAATNILVKVETGHVALLGKIGINTKDAAGKTIDATTAVQRLTALYGGQASAYTDTFAGKLSVLSATGDKLGVEFGNVLIPKIEEAASAVVSGISGFESFNSSLDGIPGKVLAVGAAVPAAVFAFGKLQAVGGYVVDAFSKVGTGVGNVISGIGRLVSTSTAATTAEGAQAAATATSAAAFTEKSVALAIVGVAEGKEAAATSARVAAEEALAFATHDALASDVEIVTASNAVVAARIRETAATEAATAAREASAGAGGTEVVGATAGVGLGAVAAAAAPIVATAGAIALAIKGGDDLDKTMRQLADALVAGGTAASDASGKFAHILGPTAAADLNKYAIAAQSGGSASEQAANKAKILADAFTQVGLTTKGYTKIGDQYTQTASAIREQVDAATSAIDKLTKKYGEAGVQTIQLSAAQKTYADDLASGHATAATLAADKKNVIDLSTKQATTQNAVNDATQQGTDIANHNGIATTAQTAALKAQDAATKALATSLDKYGAIAGSSAENAARAQGLNKTQVDALAAAYKALTASLDKYGAEAGPDFEKVAKAAGIPKGAIDALTASTKLMNAGIDKAFGDASTVISNWASAAKFNLKGFEAELLKNVVAAANWSKNIATLSKDGINQGFLQTLVDAGVKAAPVVQGLVDGVKSGSVTAINNIEAVATQANVSAKQAVDGTQLAAAAATQGVVNTAAAAKVAAANIAAATQQTISLSVAAIQDKYQQLVGYINGVHATGTFSANVIPEIGGQPASANQFAALAIDLHNPGAGLKFAEGGWVPGPPGKEVAATVHAGEFVLSKKMLDDAKVPTAASPPTLSALKTYPLPQQRASTPAPNVTNTTTFANTYHINAQGNPTPAELDYINRQAAWQLTRSGRR